MHASMLMLPQSLGCCNSSRLLLQTAATIRLCGRQLNAGSHPKVWVILLHAVLKVATLPRKQPEAEYTQLSWTHANILALYHVVLGGHLTYSRCKGNLHLQ